MPGLTRYIFSVTLLVVFTPTFSFADANGPVISCYQCHSKYDDDCEHLSVNSSIFYKPCVENNKYADRVPFCRKITQKIHAWEGKEVTVRKCGWVRHEQECYRMRSWDYSETVCQCFLDGCNFGSLLRSSLGLLLLSLLVTYVSIA